MLIHRVWVDLGRVPHQGRVGGGRGYPPTFIPKILKIPTFVGCSPFLSPTKKLITSLSFMPPLSFPWKKVTLGALVQILPKILPVACIFRSTITTSLELILLKDSFKVKIIFITVFTQNLLSPKIFPLPFNFAFRGGCLPPPPPSHLFSNLVRNGNVFLQTTSDKGL